MSARPKKRSTFFFARMHTLIKGDLKSLFEEFFDSKVSLQVEEIGLNTERDQESIAVLSFLSRNLMRPVLVHIDSCPRRIVPVVINGVCEKEKGFLMSSLSACSVFYLVRDGTNDSQLHSTFIANITLAEPKRKEQNTSNLSRNARI
jgi:hypothetical protein